jgi:hypothetical protein
MRHVARGASLNTTALNVSAIVLLLTGYKLAGYKVERMGRLGDGVRCWSNKDSS